MSKYEVGDVAALFSKPKEPTTEAGKKLQALFKEFHGNNKSTFQSQEASLKQNYKSKIENEENKNQKVFKKNKKRKFSTTFDQESSLNEKHEETNQETVFKNEKKKNKNFSEEKNFVRKKKKASKSDSSNFSTFTNFEVNESVENDIKSTDNSKLNNSPKGKKPKLSFMKKSKHHHMYDANYSSNKGKNTKPKVNAEAFDSDDESFKEEVKNFIKSNSKSSKKKNSNNSEKSSQKKSDEDSSSIVKSFVNKHESQASSNFSPKDKTHVSDFIRKPKNKNKVKNNSFEDDDNEQSELSNKKSCDNSDTLFKSENENYVKNNNKKFNKKLSESKNSVRNSRKSPSINRPEFEKLLEKNSEADKADQLTRTLFVGNLPLTTRLNDLKDLFSPFGEIDYIRFKGIETDKAKIFGENVPKSLNTNYAAHSVPGFIVFKERESAVNALTLCGTVFKNHHITVDFALPSGSKKLYDEKQSIFIGNLPFDVKDESIWDAFSDCGKIVGVRVVRDKETGIGKGFGYVLFSNAESRKHALSLEDLKIEGRSIRIKAIDSNKKTQKNSGTTPVKIDTFKSRAIRFKNKNRNANTNSRKSIKKLVKKQKTVHKKKKIASLLQKSMK